MIWRKSQIDFLNSVIVDMQRKNQALMCKIEVLEIGVPANEADDYTQSTLDKRMLRRVCSVISVISSTCTKQKIVLVKLKTS